MYDKKQQEAFANEYKGNLFEYLVGSLLARHFRIESLFVRSLDESYRRRLSEYELLLRNSHPGLAGKLRVLASSTFEQIVKEINFPSSINSINLTGKAQHKQVDFNLQEADLLIKIDDFEIPMSIKLTKDGSFVNTKSGGIKTFLEKYFKAYSSSFDFQAKLNSVSEKSFFEMGDILYEMSGLEFKGSFDEQWTAAGLAVLPGQLSLPMSEIVYRYYNRVTQIIYQALQEFLKEDREKFVLALMPILGLGKEEMVQVKCFYKGENYDYTKTIIHSYKNVWHKARSSCQLSPMQEGKGFFEIVLSDMRLQIRVKPMNQFIVPSLKVNCSVKDIPHILS